MAIDFSDSPSVNQTYSVGNKVWKWNGTRWVAASGVSQNAELSDIDDVLYHDVPQVKSERRISLSFNTFMSGPFGSIEMLTFVD